MAPAKLILILLLATVSSLFAQEDIAELAANQSAPAAGGGGGPTLVAQDNFDAYSHATALDSAADWIAEGTASINIYSDAGDGEINPGSSAIGTHRHTATFAANQRSELTIKNTGSGGSGNFNWIGPAVRLQAGANTGYAVVFGPTDLYLISINAGTAATINSDTGMSFSPGNKVAIEVSGAGTSARLKVQIDTGAGWVDKWTDQNPAVDIDGGSAGVANWVLSTTEIRGDDWKGYDL